MTREELGYLNLGRFDFSIAKYAEPYWGLDRLSMDKPCYRWRLNIGRFGVRFEYYRKAKP